MAGKVEGEYSCSWHDFHVLTFGIMRRGIQSAQGNLKGIQSMAGKVEGVYSCSWHDFHVLTFGYNY